MKNKILIFEDDETYFKIIYYELAKYDVDIYPSPGDEFNRFSNSMVYYASKPNDKNFGEIKNYVVEFNPNIVILDICFDENRPTDQSGMTVKSNLLDVDYRDTVVYYYSKRIKSYIDENLQINKSPHLHADVKYKIADVFGFKLVNSRKTVPSEQQVFATASKESSVSAEAGAHTNGTIGSGHFEKAEPKEQSSDRPGPPPAKRKRIGFPESLSRWAEFERYNLSSWFSEVTDKIIVYIFYILIVISFALGGWRLLYSYYKYFNDLIHVAEYAFTAFLPLLIIVSLFALYKHSLRGYILDDPLAPKDIEEGSKLMMFSKKLFISSLASFLFLKMIEHIDSYSDYGVLVFLTKLGSYFAGIFILVGYYIYLNMSHGHKK